MKVAQGRVITVEPRRVGPGQSRKVALIGTAPTHRYAPWEDASWEIWAHASAWNLCRRVDRWFDLHPESRWREMKPYHPDYQNWLKTQTVPVYMQQRYPEIAASVRYPKERILAEFPRYFSSQVAWMIALALTEGVTHLSLYGVHYGFETEYASQRAGCEFWMGVAYGRGVQLQIIDKVPLLKEPPALYGYEDAAWHQWTAHWKKERAATALIPAKSMQALAPDAPLPEPNFDGLNDQQAKIYRRARADEFWMLRKFPPASSLPEEPAHVRRTHDPAEKARTPA